MCWQPYIPGRVESMEHPFSDFHSRKVQHAGPQRGLPSHALPVHSLPQPPKPEVRVTRPNENPGAFAPGFLRSRRICARVSAAQLITRHEAVVAELSDLPPLIAVIGEVGQRFIDLLEVLV